MPNPYEEQSIDFFVVASMASAGQNIFEGRTDIITCHLIFGSLYSFLLAKGLPLVDAPAGWIVDLDERLSEAELILASNTEALLELKRDDERISAEVKKFLDSGGLKKDLARFRTSDQRDYLSAQEFFYIQESDLIQKIERFSAEVGILKNLKGCFLGGAVNIKQNIKFSGFDYQFNTGSVGALGDFEFFFQGDAFLRGAKRYVGEAVENLSRESYVPKNISAMLLDWISKLTETSWSNPIAEESVGTEIGMRIVALEGVRSAKASLLSKITNTVEIAPRSHNNPPELVDDDQVFRFAEILWEPLDAAEKELQKPKLDPAKLERIGQQILDLVNKITLYAAEKVDKFVDSAVAELGQQSTKWMIRLLAVNTVAEAEVAKVVGKSLLDLAKFLFELP